MNLNTQRYHETSFTWWQVAKLPIGHMVHCLLLVLWLPGDVNPCLDIFIISAQTKELESTLPEGATTSLGFHLIACQG